MNIYINILYIITFYIFYILFKKCKYLYIKNYKDVNSRSRNETIRDGTMGSRRGFREVKSIWFCEKNTTMGEAKSNWDKNVLLNRRVSYTCWFYFNKSIFRMKKIIKLKVRNADGVEINSNVISCCVEEAYKKDYIDYFNKQWKCWRWIVNIYLTEDEDIDEDFIPIHYQDTFRTLHGAIRAVETYVQEWMGQEIHVSTL